MGSVTTSCEWRDDPPRSRRISLWLSTDVTKSPTVSVGKRACNLVRPRYEVEVL